MRGRCSRRRAAAAVLRRARLAYAPDGTASRDQPHCPARPVHSAQFGGSVCPVRSVGAVARALQPRVLQPRAHRRAPSGRPCRLVASAHPRLRIDSHSHSHPRAVAGSDLGRTD
jgi:hypothetical protein